MKKAWIAHTTVCAYRIRITGLRFLVSKQVPVRHDDSELASSEMINCVQDGVRSLAHLKGRIGVKNVDIAKYVKK